MNRGELPKEFRPLSHAENKMLKTSEELHVLGDDQSKISTLKGGDIQAVTIHPRDLNKIHIPKPPKGRQKPALMAAVRKTKQADEVKGAVRRSVADPVNLDRDSQPLDYTGSEGLRFDDQGMVLPHSILGSLEDFRRFLEAKGETELVQRIPTCRRPAPSEAVENARGIPSGHRNIQSNALQHWHSHMTQRRRQQELLSDYLDRPVGNILMNQADRFRETQEQREFLNQVMPLIHSGYGNRVGSEFWSLPQRIGDATSGISATLTQTQQGKREPVTHVGQPSSIREETGNICATTQRRTSRTWDQSAYLQHLHQELGEVLQDMDNRKPNIDGLEVIGSGKQFPFVTVCRSPLLEKEEEETEHKMKKENPDPLAQYDDVRSDALLIPALRFCGQLARWTGNSTTEQGEVGISARLIFEALTGEMASSHLELHNEGSTAIFYSWQQLPMSRAFPNLQSRTKSLHFYFNSSSGVIRPGDTQRVEFIFKSEVPGIKTELWRLNTHPVLLRGASMQVTLRGVALYQDKTADQRLFIETKLDKVVQEKMCRSIVYKMLRGVHTPERPSSPAELYVTEEQEFLSKNPKLQYLHQPLEDLKTLWQEVQPEHTWDLSVDTLRQVVLSLPDEESAQENSLAQLNSLLLQLSEPPQLKHRQLTAAAVGQQLWRKLFDTMDDEAVRLRNLLGIPDPSVDKKEESPQISDADMADDKGEKSEKRGGTAAKEERNEAKPRGEKRLPSPPLTSERNEAKHRVEKRLPSPPLTSDRNEAKPRFKDDIKGESKSAATEKSVEVVGEKDSKKKGKRREEVRTRSKEKLTKVLALLAAIPPDIVSQQPPDDQNQNVEPEVMATYTRLLHKKVYALMEDLVDNLCDLTDELNVGDEQDTHTIN